MPEVAFHTGLVDKVAYACRLLRKAWRQRVRVVVTGDRAALERLDAALWVFEPQEFVPHARRVAEPAPAHLEARTPIWLVDPGGAPPAAEVLVNLGPEPCADAQRFERVVELVEAGDDERAAGRRRWNAYKAAGWSIVHHPQEAQS